MRTIIAIILPLLVMSWWDSGHMLVASIAETRMNQLSPVTSSKIKNLVQSINALCDNKTQTFIEAACWADDIKKQQYFMNIWNQLHFIDIPYIQSSVFPTLNYTSQQMNSVTTYKQALQVLMKNINNNTAERALFARYLVHLVGDMHQPLHSVTMYNQTYPSGDAGGNLLKVRRIDENLMNFHSFWDSGAFMVQNDTWYLSRPLSLHDITVLRMTTGQFITQYGDQVEQLSKKLKPEDWIQQTFQIAKNFVYPRMNITQDVGRQYTNQAFQICKKQITLAGYRLANILIGIYGSNQVKNIRTQEINQQ